MKGILKNWKTSLSGVGLLITGIGSILAKDYTNGSAQIIAGIGLIFSKDITNQ
jgi:hypothetical protein